MESITPRASARPQYVLDLLIHIGVWILVGVFGLLVVLQLVFFAVHAAHMLAYPYPLDYGEGPLLSQLHVLRAGTPIWRLYADPDIAPYAVVNYPPVYHLFTLLLAWPLNNELLAGRLVSLFATFAAVVALWMLVSGYRSDDQPRVQRLLAISVRLCIVLAFLALPIVREWAVVMRVDMLGVALGLWSLVIVQRYHASHRVYWAALPLVLCVLTKPSLIAAPSATLLWLLFRDWRRALQLGAMLALIGTLVVALLQLSSGGWFAIHVIVANANPWQSDLAHQFWHDQLLILWPLLVVAALGIVAQLLRRWPGWQLWRADAATAAWILPVYYTLFGALVAYTVGKVGAYTNYFLEFYAGLIWLTAAYLSAALTQPSRPIWRQKLAVGAQQTVMILLLIGAFTRYYPIWSETYLKFAGIIEGRNPPRIVVGSYGVWQDLRRERAILATLSGVNAALVDQVRAANAPIFTDVPGVAAQAHQLSRLQVFEYRQLLDVGRADQSLLLRDMANGRVPLVVLDYLGNWLTPQAIAIITHRYAQDGSRGTYDIYRPVDPGLARPIDLAFPNNLQLTSYHVLAGENSYHSGETMVLTLDWQQRNSADMPIDVVLQLQDARGFTLLESSRPLLYGVLPPPKWGMETVQHMQPLALPAELPAGVYTLALELRNRGQALGPAQVLTAVDIAAPDEQMIGGVAYYVPAALFNTWQRLGGKDGMGNALMPATPFAGFTLQCFERGCLKLTSAGVMQVALGELVHLADVALPTAPIVDKDEDLFFPETQEHLVGEFRLFWQNQGGEAVLGPPITPELIRGDWIVQYTRYARLERPLNGGPVQRAALGVEFLRLPGGVAYRWP